MVAFEELRRKQLMQFMAACICMADGQLMSGSLITVSQMTLL